MKKTALFILFLCVTLLAAGAAYAGNVHHMVISTPVPATPTPAPSRGPIATPPPWVVTPSPAPSPTPDASVPVVVDRINHPSSWTSFRFDRNAELLTVCFPPIRDCDAALVMCGGETLLIDCASSEFAGAVVEMLDELGVTRIDTVVITHPHHDHYQGLPAVLEHVSVGRVLVSFPDDYNEHMPRIRAMCGEHGVPLERFGDGDALTVGGAVITVYDRSPEHLNCNNRSAQLLLRYGERSILFSADIEWAGMRALALSAEEGELRADILKYPHHGKAALHIYYAEAVRPLFSVVTNKARDWEGQRWLRDHHVPYVNTRVGGVILRTDGGAHWTADRLYDRLDPRGR